MAQTPSQDDENTAFPASKATPGQAESRQARKCFLDQAGAVDEEGSPVCPWMQEYLQLRLEGWDWRKAAYIAWASSPMAGRWPANQQQLALEVLGLRSDRTIRTWVEKNPEIRERIARLQVEPLMQHKRDVILSLLESTKKLGKDGAPDRRLYFTLTGDLKPGKGAQEDADRKGKATSSPYAAMNDEELEQVIRNLKAAAGGQDADDDAVDSDAEPGED